MLMLTLLPMLKAANVVVIIKVTVTVIVVVVVAVAVVIVIVGVTSPKKVVKVTITKRIV